MMAVPFDLCCHHLTLAVMARRVRIGADLVVHPLNQCDFWRCCDTETTWSTMADATPKPAKPRAKYRLRAIILKSYDLSSWWALPGFNPLTMPTCLRVSRFTSPPPATGSNPCSACRRPLPNKDFLAAGKCSRFSLSLHK